jgi:hypothetical protein
MRMFGIYNLLCDHCNLLFRGFAVPGTVSKPGTHKKKNRQAERAVNSEGLVK